VLTRAKTALTLPTGPGALARFACSRQVLDGDAEDRGQLRQVIRVER
jgi:hypothetical protein